MSILKHLRILIILTVFSVVTAWRVDYITTKNKLIRIEEHLYSHFETFDTDYEFFYGNGRIDSIVFGFADEYSKNIARYQDDSNKIIVNIHDGRNDTLIKSFEYEFDSIGRLAVYKGYGNNKIINEDSFFYDNENKLKNVKSVRRGLWVEGESYLESVYIVNDNYNIDTVYEYYLDGKNKKLNTVRVFKYDTKINPFKDLLYFSIHERFFNSNNITACYYLDDSLHVRDSIINKYNYNNEGYLTRYFDDDLFESDSLVQMYHYNR